MTFRASDLRRIHSCCVTLEPSEKVSIAFDAQAGAICPVLNGFPSNKTAVCSIARASARTDAHEWWLFVHLISALGSEV